jgi:hypothetical protein
MKTTRKGFITQGIYAGMVLTGITALISACGGITRASLRDNENNVPGDILTPDKAEILRLASLAPSGHNSQPWKIKALSPEELILCADHSRRLPAVDPENRELLLSLGAFLENLSIAAGSLGYAADIRITARTPQDTEIARITLRRETARPYPPERLSRRSTVKQGFLDRELSGGDVRYLSESLPGHCVYFPKGSQHARCISEGTAEAFRAQAMRDDAQRELVQWLRLSGDHARCRMDGLTTEGMGMTGIKGWAVRTFMDPEDFLTPANRQRGIDMTARLTSEGAGWIVITGYPGGVAGLIETGRRFQRMALLARERMIAIHPMTQMLEEPSGRQFLAANHRGDVDPQFILRVGYLERYPDPASLRRPVSWFVERG